MRFLPLLWLHDDRPLAQTIGEGNFDLARHQERGLERGFGGQPLGDPPDTDTENTENDNDRSAEHGHLLLT